MRKHYLLFGIGAAVLVGAAIVALGSSSGGRGAASGQALPPGHPAVGGRGSGQSGAATTSGAVQQTIAQLEKASAAAPTNVALLLSLGDACFLGQQYAKAARAYRGALRVKPGNETAAVRLAMVWHAEGQTGRATAAIDAVLVKDPGQQEGHYSLAIIYFSENNVEAAKSQWMAAAKIDPTSTIGRRSQSFVDLLEGKQTTEPGSGG